MSTTNLSVKNTVNNIKKPNTVGNSKPISTNTTGTTGASAGSTSPTNNALVDTIALHIKNKLSSNLQYFLMFVIPILLLLFYLLYNYNFDSVGMPRSEVPKKFLGGNPYLK